MPRRFAALTLLSLTLPSLALAQHNSDEIARRELIERAERASDRNDHAGALEQAERAGRIRMTTSLRLLLAQEHRALSHPLEALEQATACQREAQAQSSLHNRRRILGACTSMVSELQRQVGRLTVRVPSPAPAGLTVRVGDESVSEALWGVARPVRPGQARVEASQGGRVVFTREVTVSAGQEATVEVSVAPEPAAAPTPTPVVQAPAQPASTATNVDVRPAPTPRPETRSGGPGAGPWVVAGTGVALIALGGVFWALREGAVGNCTVESDAIACPTAEDATRAEGAAGMGIAANVSIGVGIAAVAGGALWWVLGRSRERSGATVSVSPMSGGAALGVSGRF